MPGQAVWLTGATGFVGRWMTRRLRELGREVVALTRDGRAPAGVTFAARLDLERAALSPWGEPVVAIDSLPAPAGLIHLAALSFPPECEARPEKARAVNAAGPARLYEQLLGIWPELRVLHVSSGYVYKPQSEPLREEQPLAPANAYGASKLLGEAVALGLRDRGHSVSVLRPFNHGGPGQSPRFALPSFALRLAALEQAGGGKLAVGALDRVRDFLHVRDVVECYLRLLEKAGEADIVNICSGQGRNVGDLLGGLIARVAVAVEVEQDPRRLRPGADADRLVGDTSRLQALLGAAPVLDEEALLDEITADARARVEAGEDLARA